MPGTRQGARTRPGLPHDLHVVILPQALARRSQSLASHRRPAVRDPLPSGSTPSARTVRFGRAQGTGGMPGRMFLSPRERKAARGPARKTGRSPKHGQQRRLTCQTSPLRASVSACTVRHAWAWLAMCGAVARELRAPIQLAVQTTASALPLLAERIRPLLFAFRRPSDAVMRPDTSAAAGLLPSDTGTCTREGRLQGGAASSHGQASQARQAAASGQPGCRWQKLRGTKRRRASPAHTRSQGRTAPNAGAR